MNYATPRTPAAPAYPTGTYRYRPLPEADPSGAEPDPTGYDSTTQGTYPYPGQFPGMGMGMQPGMMPGMMPGMGMAPGAFPGAGAYPQAGYPGVGPGAYPPNGAGFGGAPQAQPSPVSGPASQPPYGGPTDPAPDGWGHTDPLGRPYARKDYEGESLGGMVGGGATGYHHSGGEVSLEALVSELYGALDILQQVDPLDYNGPGCYEDDPDDDQYAPEDRDRMNARDEQTRRDRDEVADRARRDADALDALRRRRQPPPGAHFSAYDGGDDFPLPYDFGDAPTFYRLDYKTDPRVEAEIRRIYKELKGTAGAQPVTARQVQMYLPPEMRAGAMDVMRDMMKRQGYMPPSPRSAPAPAGTRPIHWQTGKPYVPASMMPRLEGPVGAEPVGGVGGGSDLAEKLRARAASLRSGSGGGPTTAAGVPVVGEEERRRFHASLPGAPKTTPPAESDDRRWAVGEIAKAPKSLWERARGAVGGLFGGRSAEEEEYARYAMGFFGPSPKRPWGATKSYFPGGVDPHKPARYQDRDDVRRGPAAQAPRAYSAATPDATRFLGPYGG